MTRHDRNSGNDGPESVERDPGIPKYYFLRTSKPLKPRKLTRSESGPAPFRNTAPTESRQQQLRRVGAATLRAKPLSLASLAEDLAPHFHSDSVEELPPGISECRTKLEAFRSAAVEAISTEASMQIEQQRKNAESMTSTAHDKPPMKRRQAGYRPPYRPAIEGPPPGIDECRRKLLAFKEVVEKAERQGEGQVEHLVKFQPQRE
mmetsp:Transcript_92165/g.112866  ORF Transcript_92165/g.112866 Transcript_92165/m.112866 type:complete len:205 (-) Transcript_92165:183-797(-)